MSGSQSQIFSTPWTLQSSCWSSFISENSAPSPSRGTPGNSPQSGGNPRGFPQGSCQAEPKGIPLKVGETPGDSLKVVSRPIHSWHYLYVTLTNQIFQPTVGKSQGIDLHYSSGQVARRLLHIEDIWYYAYKKWSTLIRSTCKWVCSWTTITY